MKKFIKKIYPNLISRPSYFTYKLFNTTGIRYRLLTEDEIKLAQKVFHHLIDYRRVKIFDIPYLPWQPADILMAPNGSLYVNKALFCKDYSKSSMAMQGVFIHEMAHVLQFQSGENVLLKGFYLQAAYYLSFKRYNPYKYTFVDKKSFGNYNIEQQGDIARDIFFDKLPNIICQDIPL